MSYKHQMATTVAASILMTTEFVRRHGSYRVGARLLKHSSPGTQHGLTQ